MSSFKQLYAHQGLKQLSQDAGVSALVSRIITHGRLHSLCVPKDAQPRIVCFCECLDSCASLNACGIWCYRGYEEKLNIKSLQISWKKSESCWNDDSDSWLVLEVLPSLHTNAVLCQTNSPLQSLTSALLPFLCALASPEQDAFDTRQH